MKKGIPLKQVASWMNSASEHSFLVFGACVDTRLLKTGDLFFACPGKSCDGHDFILEAERKGAVAAVVSYNFQGDHLNFPLLRVEDPIQALQKLSQKLLGDYGTRVVAVTGSMGKTTTKGFLAHLLASTFRVASTPGNYNSQLGLPLTVINHLEASDEVIVLEMGMTGAGQIAKLVEIAPPEIAVITGVAYAHAENFESLEAIGRAKAEILSSRKTRFGLVSQHVPSLVELVKNHHFPIETFAVDHKEATYNLVVTENALVLYVKGEELIQFMPLELPGKHNLHNFLAAAVAVHQMGVSWEVIKEHARALTLPPMRMQIQKWQGVTFINDAYNALPVAVVAALDSMPVPANKGRRIAILSEMRELGTFSEQCHLEVGNHALSKVDELFCLGQGCLPIQNVWQKAGRSVFLTDCLDELCQHLKTVIQPGDVVLIKGSRASRLSSLHDKLVIP